MHGSVINASYPPGGIAAAAAAAATGCAVSATSPSAIPVVAAIGACAAAVAAAARRPSTKNLLSSRAGRPNGASSRSSMASSRNSKSLHREAGCGRAAVQGRDASLHGTPRATRRMPMHSTAATSHLRLVSRCRRRKVHTAPAMWSPTAAPKTRCTSASTARGTKAASQRLLRAVKTKELGTCVV